MKPCKPLSSDGVCILLSDARGIYIPRDFGQDGMSEAFGVNEEDREYLAKGPDEELYWETWDDVVSSASLTDSEGNVWTLSQDGDLFAVCPELMDDEMKASHGFED